MTTNSSPESATPAKLLFIEDNPHKRSRVLEFLASLPKEINITEAHSFSSGCQEFDRSAFDIILADISLPTFDKTLTDSGGRFRAFAGLEIARKFQRNGLVGKIIFITQYRSFSEKGTSHSFQELESTLLKILGVNFGGMVFYDGAVYAWKERLASLITEALNEDIGH